MRFTLLLILMAALVYAELQNLEQVEEVLKTKVSIRDSQDAQKDVKGQLKKSLLRRSEDIQRRLEAHERILKDAANSEGSLQKRDLPEDIDYEATLDLYRQALNFLEDHDVELKY